jgi:DNA mismatch repair protein MutL
MRPESNTAPAHLPDGPPVHRVPVARFRLSGTARRRIRRSHGPFRTRRTRPAVEPQAFPLGAARAQVHENYIIAQTAPAWSSSISTPPTNGSSTNGSRSQRAATGIAAQALLIPEIVDLSAHDAATLLDHAPDLERLGLSIEPFGGSAVAVRATPAILGPVNAAALLRDILDELADQGQSLRLSSAIDAILSRMACHGSVRSGRQMRVEEMNALLREMEATPLSGQCNHGRPTYVELRLSDIERLFGRT